MVALATNYFHQPTRNPQTSPSANPAIISEHPFYDSDGHIQPQEGKVLCYTTTDQHVLGQWSAATA